VFVGVVEFLGWFGAVAVLSGYILFSLGKLPNGLAYQGVNLVGGLAITVNVAAHHAAPSTVVNSIWAAVAAVVLVRMLRARRAVGAPVAHEAHVEPPTTTAVLPVVGPALRDHEAEASVPTGPVSGLPDGSAAPMTASVPVITAAIALALVQAAQEQADRQERAGAQG
jgi:hypothetical protein